MKRSGFEAMGAEWDQGNAGLGGLGGPTIGGCGPTIGGLGGSTIGGFGGMSGGLGGSSATGMLGSPGSAGFCMKLLVTPREGSQILGAGGHTCHEIMTQSSTKIHLSKRDELYPGTLLQQIVIKSNSSESVQLAVQLIMAQLSANDNRIVNDHHDVVPGGACMKFVVPNAAAKAIIGKGGQNIALIREGTGMKVHIEAQAIGPQPISEQVVCITGTIAGMQVVLPNIFEKVEMCTQQPWFQTWANTSHAGTSGGLMPGQLLFQPSGTKTANRPPALPGAYGLPQPQYQQQQSYQQQQYGAPAAASAVASPANMQMVAAALEVVPPDLAVPGVMNQQITFNIAASAVSPLIGKGGIGVKEISANTGTKIQIREIEGNPMEKCVVIVGNTIGIISAYCHCITRVFNAPPQHQHQQAQPFQQTLQIQQHHMYQLDNMPDYSQNPELAAAAAALAEAELQAQSAYA